MFPQRNQIRSYGMAPLRDHFLPVFFVFVLLFFAGRIPFPCARADPTVQCVDDEEIHLPTGGKNITLCRRLEALGAEFGWTYTPGRLLNGSAGTNFTVDILFGARLPAGGHGWLAWGVNPEGPQMVGTRAFIALRNGRGVVGFDSYNVTADTKRGCRFQPSPNGVAYVSGPGMPYYEEKSGFLFMWLKITLPPEDYNASRLYHVWQVGSRFDGTEPKMHAALVQNFNSAEVLDLTTGENPAIHYLKQLRQVHGGLSIVGWGILLPVGIIGPRYFKKHPIETARWSRFHVICDLLAFAVGTIAWAIGVSLGAASTAYTFVAHKYIGIAIFAVAVLQVIALWLRPKENDMYFKYWAIYHHFLGYSLWAMIVVNIFQGIRILRPGRGWMWTYVGILSGLGFAFLVLEIYSVATFVSHKKKKSKVEKPGGPR